MQAAAVGTQRLCLLITTLQAGQTWTGLLFPANRENPDSLFCPTCSFPDRHGNTMPGGVVYKCALSQNSDNAPLLFSAPRQGARELLIDSGCQKCFCVTFGKVTKLSAADGSDPLRPDRKIDKKKRKQLFTTSLRRPFFGHRKIICDSELNSCDTTYSCESLSL